MSPAGERAGVLHAIRDQNIYCAQHESNNHQGDDGNFGALAVHDGSDALPLHQGRLFITGGRAASGRFPVGRLGCRSVSVSAKVMNVAKYVLALVVFDSVVGDAHLRSLPLRYAVLSVASDDTTLNGALGVHTQRRDAHPFIILHHGFAHFKFCALLAPDARPQSDYCRRIKCRLDARACVWRGGVLCALQARRAKSEEDRRGSSR